MSKGHPFFLYVALTIPHANNELKEKGMEVPSDEPYSKEPWPQAEKNKAAMITRLDDSVGKIMTRLKELGLDENTVVFFSRDKGPHKEGGVDPKLKARDTCAIKRDVRRRNWVPVVGGRAG
jgi:arylsulfatase A-like enzyme